jgi:RNA polymerase sigma-70 factor (sigma-E family)
MNATIPLSSMAVAGDSLDVSTDALSFEQFYEATYPKMLRLAAALLPSKAMAEDVVHDAYAQVFRKYETVHEPNAYVRRAIVNATTGFFRKRAVASAKEPIIRASAETQFVDHDALLSVLDSLPQRQRAAILLRYYEQCTEAEIASILRCRPGTVKSLLSRGIAALREVVPND